MSIITLTSDWQNNSFYINAIKAYIVSNCANANIIDLTHSIVPHSITDATFFVKNNYKNFPNNTIHIIAVKSESDENQKHLIVKYAEQYFISNDNGIFSLLFEEPVQKIIQIDNNNEETTFPELNVFAKIACQIANGKNIMELGTEMKTFKKRFPIKPVYDNDFILGKVIYIDAYKNVFTNIDKELFYKVCKERDFVITIKSNKNKITKINKKYNETEPGELLAIFNFLNLLEIAQYNGKIAELLSLKLDIAVRINFK